MVLASPTSPEIHSCRHLLEGQAKNLADRLYGPDGPPLGTTFAQLEQVARGVSENLQKLLFDLLLHRQADAMHRPLPDDIRLCPKCGRETHPREPEPRLLHCRSIVVEWQEPQRYCGHCRRAYFPQSRTLGLDLGHYSPDLLDRIIYAGANALSFRQASKDLGKLSDQAIDEKQVERLTKRIGLERLEERQAETAQYLKLPLTARCEQTPAGVAAPGSDQVAVVMADAGMLQLRDEKWASPDKKKGPPANDAPADEAEDEDDDEDEEEEEGDEERDRPPSGRHWHEDKVGLVMTMHSTVSDSDPSPEIPKTFLDPHRVGKIVNGVKKLRAPSLDEDKEEASESSSAAEEAADSSKPNPAEVPAEEYKGPKLEARRVVASRLSWPKFGPILAAAAWLAGFAPAQRKAFVADGAHSIWRVWKSRFSSYVPILDFIHALSYAYGAAQAIGGDALEKWKLYSDWIRWVWQGDVAKVIECLAKWQAEHGVAEKDETGPRKVVAKALNYLRNNEGRMKYAEYRKQGLPLVSSLVESMVKQIGRRVKGTEKFWGEEGAGAILQLRGDYLSDGEVMEGFWSRRQGRATGQRTYRMKPTSK